MRNYWVGNWDPCPSDKKLDWSLIWLIRYWVCGEMLDFLIEIMEEIMDE